METKTEAKNAELEGVVVREAKGPITTSAMELVGPAVVNLLDASLEAEKLLTQRVEAQKRMLRVAIGLTSPSQWVVMAPEGGKSPSIYPTGGAADTILRRAFGCTWEEKTVIVEKDPSGVPVKAIATGTLCQGDRVVEKFEGHRKMGGFVKTEADLIKGALENMKSIAVRDLLGLRGRTPEELAELGLDPSKLTSRVDFRDRSDDNAAAGEATVPWGDKKGTRVSALDDRDLVFYAGRAEASIADPAKAKYAAKEKKWLDALKAEQKKRADAKAAPAPKPSPKTEGKPADSKTAPPDVLTFGPAKGKRITEATTAQLEESKALGREKVKAEPSAKWAASVLRECAAIDVELEQRAAALERELAQNEPGAEG